MNKNQRAALASRLRQFAELRRAAVSTVTALATAVADNPMADKVTPAAFPDLLPASLPHTRALLASGEEGVSNGLIEAVADVLDEPGARGAGWSVLFISVGCAGLVVVLFSILVAPAFKDMFESFGAQLPAPTVLALFLTQWMVGPLGALLVLIVLLNVIWSLRPDLLGELTPRVDAMLRKAPLIGHANRVIQTKRLAAWLAASGTGGDMKRRLDCLVEIAGPGQFRRQVSQLAIAVQGGQSLLASLAAPGWLPGLALVLQDANKFDADANDSAGKKLSTYANTLDARADAVSARLTLWAQLILGVIIGFFVVAMYLPIFKLGSII